MVSRFRTSACLGLLLLMSSLSIFGSGNPTYLLVKPTTETVQAIRYQSGTLPTGPWIEMDMSIPTLVLQEFDSLHDRLYIQQSEDKLSWSSSYEYRYDPATEAWTIHSGETRNPSLIDSLDIKLYGLYPVFKSTTCYSHVLGAALKMNFSLDNQNRLFGYGEIAYSKGPSNTDWVESMQAVNMSVGIGYGFDVADKLQVIPELGYGLVLHLLDADFDEDGTSTAETFLDQQVRFSLNLGYALTETYELIVAPLGVLFFEKGSVGTLFGLHTGLRFNF
ncbi:MAG TPA: hypothetical protein DIW48_08555 [Sphaerochaeta sp.]|nr:hypothetical protein [Sphaerochaeta sp.]